jgi:uncharacterized protein
MSRSTQTHPVKKRKLRTFISCLIGNLSMILAVTLLFLIYIFQIEPNWYEVRQVTLTLPHLPAAFDRYRIVELTDLHVDNLQDVNRLKRIVQLTTQQQPDLDDDD